MERTAKQQPKKGGGGRPTTFSQKVADEICDRLIKPESLRSICRDKGMPDIKTVFRWVVNDDAFRQQYARAREIQADVIADETCEIADDGRNDWMEVETKKGRYIKLCEEAVSRSRLRIDQRKWYLSKLSPKKYGDKIEHQHDGNLVVKVKIGGDA